MPVYPAEGLWWVADMTRFTMADKSEWDWTMMIAQPECPSYARLWVEQRRAPRRSKRKALAAIQRVRFETYAEGPSAQVLYTGPFADEGPTIAALLPFIEQQGRTLAGKHHEIYLSDMRRTAPEKLKTVIRQPMR